MRIAAQVRLEKDKYPERFCPDTQCLWRIWTRLGAKPCPDHMGVRNVVGRPPVGVPGEGKPQK